MNITDLLKPEAQRYLERTQAMYNDMKDAEAAGEIILPKFAEWKSLVSRLCDAVRESILAEYTYAGKYKDLPQDVQDFVWALGFGTQAFKSLPNKLKKVAAKDSPVIKAFIDAYQQLKPYLDITESLKDKVVKTSVKRAQAKAVAATATAKKFSDASTLVNVLTKHIDEYVARAEELSKSQFKTWMGMMSAAGWDLDVIAPRAKSTDRTEDYRRKEHKRSFFQSITVSADGKDAHRKESPELRKRYIDNAKQDSHDAYMAWVHKMVEKIGKPVTKATMSGDPWAKSTITVTTNDGEQQVWNSQMILNRSKYGKLFNQFPSRKAK